MQKPFGFGWQPDLPDQRDRHYAQALKGELPAIVDLRGGCPPVYNQGALGSCTAQAVVGLCQFSELEEKRKLGTPSRLFVYYNTRVIQGSVNQDSGASIRNAIKSVVDKGFCRETLWKHDIRRFKTKPTDEAYQAAESFKVKAYQRVKQTEVALKEAVANFNPVVFGFSVYENFKDTGKDGKVPMPKGKVTGGHAVLIVGYDDNKKHFIVRNSWGDWGDGGYCYMPYAFVTAANIASDFWTITDAP